MNMRRCFPVVFVGLLFSSVCVLPATAGDVCANAAEVCKITLSPPASPGGNCSQNVPSGSACTLSGASVAIQTAGVCVLYSAGGKSFDVQFGVSLAPFYDLNAGKKQKVRTGPLKNPTPGTDLPINYKSVTIDGSTCPNGSSMGLIMK